jgi:hypothetical protein
MSTTKKILIGLLVLIAIIVIAGGGYALYYVGYRVGFLSEANLEKRTYVISGLPHGFPPSRMLKGPYGQFGYRGWYDQYCSIIDKEELLADKLDITVEELQDAQLEAYTAAIEKAVEKELITQEQADLMLSYAELKDYIDKEAILTDALGISIEELQTSCEEGKTLYKLIDELDLEVAEVLESLNKGFKEAIEKAVKDGVITQEQADQILNGKWFGFYGPMIFGGRGGFLGQGGFRRSGGFRSRYGFGSFGKF